MIVSSSYGEGGIFGGHPTKHEAGVYSLLSNGPAYGEPCGVGSGRVYGYEAYACS